MLIENISNVRKHVKEDRVKTVTDYTEKEERRKM